MTLTRLLRAWLRRALTDPLGAWATVVARLRADPGWVLVNVTETIDPDIRERLFPRLLAVLSRIRARIGRANTALALCQVFLHHGLGNEDDVTAVIREATEWPPCGGRATLAGAAVRLDRAELALSLLDPLPPSDRVLAVRVRAFERLGEYDEALTAVERMSGRANELHAELERKLRAELAALDPAWKPRSPDGARVNGPVRGRALHLINNCLPYRLAGYTVRTHQTALAQRKVGIEPLLVTKPGFPWNQGYFDAQTRTVIEGVEYRHIEDPEATRRGTADRVERAVADIWPTVAAFRPAVIHATTPFDNALCALGLGAAGDVPVIYELRGFLEDTWLSKQTGDRSDSQRYQLSRAREADCARRADRVVTIGHAMRQDLLARGVPASAVDVVPNAVDPDRFSPRDRAWIIRQRFGFRDRDIVLGYISSLTPYEGITTLVEATRILSDRGCDVRLLVVGRGSEYLALRDRSRELGLEDRAFFPGRVAHRHILGYYEAIDVFVVPRRDERVCRVVPPLKPVEAMAMERAVVVSRLPALTELIEEGTTGLAFEPDDPGDLADVVEPILGDSATRRDLGSRARQWVQDGRTWAHNGERYRSIYASLGAC